jgi:hypothetical protein
LSTEEILRQKDQILAQMSKEMAIPKEVLVEQMYEKRAKKEAKKQVQEDLRGGDENASGNVLPTSNATKLQREVSNKSLQRQQTADTS